jgi:hypothetical protein
MRRLRQSRLRSMATRTALDGSVTVTPQVRTIAGWLIAIAIIVGAAFFVGRLGSPDAPASGAGGSGDATPTLLPIAFGTAIDPATGEVASDLRTSRFAAGDTFAYSTQPGVAMGARVYVEVLRIHRPGGCAAPRLRPGSLCDADLPSAGRNADRRGPIRAGRSGCKLS